MVQERIMMMNPNTGRDDTTIAVAIYEPTRLAILSAIDEEGELPNKQLIEAVEQRTPPELWVDNSCMWFTTTVKLHLEANEWIQKNGSPQILSLTAAGEELLASLG